MKDQQELPPHEAREVIVRRGGEEGPPPARMKYVEPVEADFIDDAGASSVLEYWQILRRRKGTVLIFAFLGTLAGLLVSLPQTPIYEARTSLEIESLNENFLDLANVNPTAPGGASSTELEISTQVKILESRSLLEKVVDKLKLAERPEFSYEPGRVSAWRKALRLLPSTTLTPREQALEIAAESFKVQPSHSTRIVEIISEWPDPRLAAAFVNTLAEIFTEHNVEARWETSQRTGDWLSRQLEEMRIKLEKFEEKLQRYARASGLMFTSNQESVAEEKLRQLQAELSKAQAGRITKQSRFELAKTSPPESLSEVLDHGPLREYQVKLTDLRRELAELSSTYTPAHYKVRRVQAQIQELEATMRKELSNIMERVGNEYEGALRREKLLSAAYATQAKLVSDQAGRAIQYNILRREVDTSRQIYDSLLQKVKEAAVASAMSASNIRVVDPATPPRFPSKPNHLLNIALGLLSGVFLGVVFVFVRERADRTLKQPGDATYYLNVPELGVIPASSADSSQGSNGKRGLSVKIRRKKLGKTGAAAPDSSELGPQGSRLTADSIALVTWQRKPSLSSECFRATLTSILYAGNNGKHPQMLVVTSPSPSEGKTSVVSNLAVCLAEIKQRVLIIDADMRKPRQHSIFDVPNSWGLSDLLREQNPIGGLPLEAIALETEIPGLYVLPSGPGTHSIANLLHSPRTRELLQRVREEFNTVLIDTPPMMQISDARVLARMADAVILVLRAGQTTRDSARAAKERFVEDGTPVLGTVLNGWDPKVNGYGYYDNYYDYQSYYSEKREG